MSRLPSYVQRQTVPQKGVEIPPRSRADFDAIQAARAVYYTAVRFLGYARFERVEGPTVAAVEAQVAERAAGRPWMIYAVTPEGMSIHLKNVPPTSYEKSSK